MLSGLFVNAGNYVYNLWLGRALGPTQFADAAMFVTLLLMLSFMAMTYQLGVTRFVAEKEGGKQLAYVRWIKKRALMLGLVVGAVFIFGNAWLQEIFNVDASYSFTAFGLFVPLYFLMSVHRGRMQGAQNFMGLSGSYQFEMLGRLGFTILFILLWPEYSILGVVLGIGSSFVVGLFPFPNTEDEVMEKVRLNPLERKQIRTFLCLTALYEGAQIVCNNSDILLVKHYFPSDAAGLYASLALIGRVIYFVTWMFIMLLLPKVVQLRKEGRNAMPLFRSYLVAIISVVAVLLSICFLMPDTLVSLLFGEAYLAIAPYLGWYAIATSLFSLSNLFAYYFMSLDKYAPVLISLVFGGLQIAGIVIYHESFNSVIAVQIILMALLLLIQLIYFRWSGRSKV